jgi:hypothetical protein
MGNINLETQENQILIASIPIAVFMGTTIAIAAYFSLGESSALYAILGASIIAAAIMYVLLKPGQS